MFWEVYDPTVEDWIVISTDTISTMKRDYHEKNPGGVILGYRGGYFVHAKVPYEKFLNTCFKTHKIKRLT